MHLGTRQFLTLVNHPFKSRVFLLTKLPSAFFSGVRIIKADEEVCLVTIPYKWFSANPFHSTYFACLAMAAELTTGTLAMAHSYQRTPAISMLVVKIEISYHKKATGITIFSCKEGPAFKNAIELAISTGIAQTVTALAMGVNKANEMVATCQFTWSFKARQKNHG